MLYHRNIIYETHYFKDCSGEDELRNLSLAYEAAPYSGGTAVDTCVSFAGWQQVEQTEACCFMESLCADILFHIYL